jgi:hypothetical protein
MKRMALSARLPREYLAKMSLSGGFQPTIRRLPPALVGGGVHPGEVRSESAWLWSLDRFGSRETRTAMLRIMRHAHRAAMRTIGRVRP